MLVCKYKKPRFLIQKAYPVLYGEKTHWSKKAQDIEVTDHHIFTSAWAPPVRWTLGILRRWAGTLQQSWYWTVTLLHWCRFFAGHVASLVGSFFASGCANRRRPPSNTACTAGCAPCPRRLLSHAPKRVHGWTPPLLTLSCEMFKIQSELQR